eukprot:1181445-Prorocentrum_minimum.AAC.2
MRGASGGSQEARRDALRGVPAGSRRGVHGIDQREVCGSGGGRGDPYPAHHLRPRHATPLVAALPAAPAQGGPRDDRPGGGHAAVRVGRRPRVSGRAHGRPAGADAGAPAGAAGGAAGGALAAGGGIPLLRGPHLQSAAAVGRPPPADHVHPRPAGVRRRRFRGALVHVGGPLAAVRGHERRAPAGMGRADASCVERGLPRGLRAAGRPQRPPAVRARRQPAPGRRPRALRTGARQTLKLGL